MRPCRADHLWSNGLCSYMDKLRDAALTDDRCCTICASEVGCGPERASRLCVLTGTVRRQRRKRDYQQSLVTQELQGIVAFCKQTVDESNGLWHARTRSSAGTSRGCLNAWRAAHRVPRDFLAEVKRIATKLSSAALNGEAMKSWEELCKKWGNGAA